MIRVRLPHGQKVIVVKDDSAFLHDSEGAQSTGLLHIPDHLVVDTLLSIDR